MKNSKNQNKKNQNKKNQNKKNLNKKNRNKKNYNKKNHNKKKTQKHRWAKWKNSFLCFIGKLKTAIFRFCIMILLICILSAFIPSDKLSNRNLIEKLPAFQTERTIPGVSFLDDALDMIGDVVSDIQEILARIMSLLSSVDQTLQSDEQAEAIGLDSIPPYEEAPFVVLNHNVPSFTKEECKKESYEYYSELDLLGRCGMTMACIGRDLMPTEERGPIGMVKPSGWKLKKYDIVDGKYIYNRCHLIGYQLTGENANVKNLITGTRYMNVEGMLPFENKVAEYIRKPGNHVVYRVTPIFEDSNLVCSGVQMEAYSVEDKGEGICFNVYVYNVQPGIEIDYLTGENWLAE